MSLLTITCHLLPTSYQPFRLALIAPIVFVAAAYYILLLTSICYSLLLVDTALHDDYCYYRLGNIDIAWLCYVSHECGNSEIELLRVVTQRITNALPVPMLRQVYDGAEQCDFAWEVLKNGKLAMSTPLLHHIF